MKVNLKIKEGNSVQTEQHEIESMNIMQMTKAIKVIKEIVTSTQDNENLQMLISEVFNEAMKEDMQVEEFGTEVLKRALGSMDVLLVEIPDKALELLSVLSNVDLDVLMQQKPEDVLDIYDAVIQENDIEKLVKRVKKSLALTKSQVKVMNLFGQKKQTEQKQAQ